MSEWLSANWGTLVVGLVVLAIVAAVVVKMVRDKKKNKGGCACGCDGCASSDLCHKS
ncbi:MAG TPA: FeoB-associated Cys-rich membrane protein [Clostridia bacterium]|nr:FeoB-associated Cys-rich membrane protein [Clostridia bacterium]